MVNPIGDSSITDTTRQRVLVEEFTGTRCVNCPAGSAELARLQEIYGDRMVVVAIHAGSFARPYPESRVDFRTPEGDALLDFLGQPLGYPSAVISRKQFAGEFDLQLSRSLWPVYLQQELELPARIDLNLRVSYDPTSRTVSLGVDLTMRTDTETPEDLRLSVMVVEDSIAEYQLTPDGLDPAYIHRHNLRDMLTAATGNSLPDDWSTGQTISRNYTYSLPNSWKEADVSLVALVHRTGGVKEVWEVTRADLIDD